MSQSITIAASEKKQTASGKSYVAFVDSDGGKWTSWDAEVWQLIKPGAKFDLEWEKSKDGKYKNITSLVFRGEEAPPPPPEPAINREKQSSIEAQNARTNLVNLLIAGKLTDAAIDTLAPRELALVAQLYDRAGVQFGYGTYTDKHHERQEAPIVTAAKAAGAVEKPIKTLGELRERLSALGVSLEDEQKRACGLEGTEPWSNLKGDYLGAYKIAQETISPASIR